MRVFELGDPAHEDRRLGDHGPERLSFSLSADGAGVAYDFGDGLHVRPTGL